MERYQIKETVAALNCSLSFKKLTRMAFNVRY